MDRDVCSVFLVYVYAPNFPILKCEIVTDYNCAPHPAVQSQNVYHVYIYTYRTRPRSSAI